MEALASAGLALLGRGIDILLRASALRLRTLRMIRKQVTALRANTDVPSLITPVRDTLKEPRVANHS